MFIPGASSVTFASESLLLLPDRAIYWPARKMLLVADVHFGKSASFRSFGLPVPEGTTAKDLSRLTRLLGQSHAERLVILGDLIHAKSGCQPEVIEAVRAWRQTISGIRITLIRGNHDRASGNLPLDWQMDEIEEPMIENGFVFTHDKPCDQDLPSFAGHIHPTVHLPDYDGSVATAPCFVFDERCVILPAFGSFTGGCKVDPQPARRLFVVAPTRVIPLSTRANSCV